jgi:acetyl-CoA C-acetyltransferase
MAADPRAPVVVGVGQFLNRVDHGAEPRSPVELALEALSLAEADAGATLAKRAGVVAMAQVFSWRYRDPARLVADAVGADRAATWYPAAGGNTPQMLLNRLGRLVAEGRLEVGVLLGAEAWRTRTGAKRAGTRPQWEHQGGDVVPDWGAEEVFTLGHPAEHARGIVAPVQTYPLFETAIMHAELTEHPGRTVADHLDTVGAMWSRFSEVAAANPHAWNREALTAEEITTPTPSNRWVGWPYTRSMVSNPAVDMASALVVCDLATARAAGIPPERMGFLHSGTEGSDLVMSRRESFTSSPSIGIGGRRALELAGTDLDGVGHLDVYSCFPSAVQLFCRELGLDPLARPLTVYGGLAFGGGPWNNPVGHALASMVDVLRADPGSLGLVTANGGNVDKHAFGVLGTEPPAQGFRHAVPQEEIDAAATPREVLEAYHGPVEVEAWTVMHDRDGAPERLIAACRTPAGERVWGVSNDPGTTSAGVGVDLGGRPGTMQADGTLGLG